MHKPRRGLCIDQLFFLCCAVTYPKPPALTISLFGDIKLSTVCAWLAELAIAPSHQEKYGWDTCPSPVCTFAHM